MMEAVECQDTKKSVSNKDVKTLSAIGAKKQKLGEKCRALRTVCDLKKFKKFDVKIV